MSVSLIGASSQSIAKFNFQATLTTGPAAVPLSPCTWPPAKTSLALEQSFDCSVGSVVPKTGVSLLLPHRAIYSASA